MITRIIIDGYVVAEEDVPAGKVLVMRENGQRFDVPAGDTLRLVTESGPSDVEGTTAFTDLFAPATIMNDVRAVLPWNWGR